MLTDTQRDIIKATVPLLETGGEALTTHFYKLMLSEYPEVRPLFNQAHQSSGAQQRALANGVLQYARHIDRLEALGPLAAQIVNKHVSLQIQPEHYPIVGTCLLRAIREVLGSDLATDEVIAAWGAAYQQLADILIEAEREAYASLAAAPGGWRGGREFRVVRKVPESVEISSFYLEPVDGGSVVDFKAGQYISLRLIVGGQEIRRNYSLSAAANGRGYRISVKREPGGVASNYLHDLVSEGSTLELFPPAGEFTLNDSNRPLVLISGGVGITPTLAMAEAALAGSNRRIIFIHYARSAQVHAFGEQIDSWESHHPQFQRFVVYEEVEAQAPREPDAVGRPTFAQLQQWLPADLDFDAYFLGPKPFMAFIKRTLRELGLPETRARYEFFGPSEALS
ncbi:NO-inducible flavohemoprotein [Metapseudomonas lalkuanensis]|uniref:nitric oxide dioxygenase n=1 Tax=Metapseudomonas lalkuanensis TaxID=2604832 RepID=A0A5J6QMW6_9GAMM|nr:NO-inducible flavohemoprotein [Pseudomonas lalkuanensis]QEY63022.1 NO-inducible flavohemoprotein [Pseudomonas lalkuanensis]